MTPQPLALAHGSFLVLVDDTGHETFAGNQAYYGLGGCGVVAEQYETLRFYWKRVRAVVNGDANAPLHAASFTATEKNLAILNEFFSLPFFFRLAATTTREASRPAGMHSMKPVVEILKRQVASITAATPCTSVILIFEQSQRADPLLQEHFGLLELEENGRSIPVEQCICPKQSGEIGLEVADFVVNAAASQTRRHMRGIHGFSLDYASVFHQVDQNLCRYLMIESVAESPSTENAQGLMSGKPLRGSSVPPADTE